MVWTLSIPEVLAISPFVFNGITIGLITWSTRFARRRAAPKPLPARQRGFGGRGDWIRTGEGAFGFGRRG
jgi:hypothetical protein